MKKFSPISIALLVILYANYSVADSINDWQKHHKIIPTKLCSYNGLEMNTSVIASDVLDKSIVDSGLKKMDQLLGQRSAESGNLLAPSEVRWPAGATQGPHTISCSSSGSHTVDVEVFKPGVTDADPNAPGTDINCVIHLGRVTAFGAGACDETPTLECIINIPMTYAGADNGQYDVFTGTIQNLPPGIYEYTCACSDDGPITDPLTHPMSGIRWIGDEPCPTINPFIRGRLTVNDAAPKDDCTNAISLNSGTNSVDNNCTADGKAWFSYIVTNGEVVNITTSSGTLTSPELYEIRLDNCTGPIVTLPITCIPPGTEVYFEAGQEDAIPGGEVCPDFGEFNITISDMDNGVTNDICDDAIALDNFGGDNELGCGETGNFTGDSDACTDTEATCFGSMTAGVWYSFTTNPAIQTFSITTTGGGVYELFQGSSCTALASLGCAVTNHPADNSTTYYLLVGPNGTVTVTADQDIPTNDECDNATTLTTTGLTNQTNVCADSETIQGCAAQEDNVVWYEFTMPANHENATITITPVGTDAITDPAIAVFGGNCGALELVDAECNSTISLTCLIPGDTYKVAIGSAVGGAGTFDLSLNTSDNGVANEVCDDADPITNTATCQYFTVTANTTGACPENFTASCNGGDNSVDATVWLSFTVPAGVNSINIRNVTPADAYIQIIAFCGATMTIPGGFCINGAGPTGNITVTAGSTYYMAVAIAGGEGVVDFEMRYNLPPTNDLCTNATTLSENTTTEGTNACATPFSTSFCGLNTTTSHTVFYEYSVPGTNIKSTNLEITLNSSTATTGSAANAIAIEFFENCSGTLLPVTVDSGDPCNALGSAITLSCVAPGTDIIIAVGSADGDEGDFTINVDENDTSIPDNDLCTNPTVINILADCDFQTENGDNTNACPENVVGGACMLDNRPTVWYEVTLPANAVGLAFKDLTGGVNLAIFDNDCSAPGYAPTQIGTCITGNIDITTGLTGGNTYLIAATSAAEGPFSFDIKAIVPPSNDLCSNAETLNNNVFAEGTTACATPWNISYCGLSTMTSHVVFYEYTVPASNTKNTKLEITIESSTATTGEAANDIRLEFFTNCSGTLLNASIESGDPCDALGNTITLDCVEPGTVITIALGSSQDNEGDFRIRVEESDHDIPDNDRCDNPTEIVIVNDCIFQTVSDDNEDACPENIGGNPCDFNNRSTIWYEVTVGPNVTGFGFQNLSPGLNIAVFDWSTCNPPSYAPTQIGPCINGDDEITSGITGGMTYLIAVSTTEADEEDIFFDIRTIAPPQNDVCANAVVLTSGTDVDGTTICATAEMPPQIAPSCPPADQTNTVFYTITIPAGNRGMDITVNSAGTVPISGNINIAVFETGVPTCDLNSSTFKDDDCISLGETSNVFRCIGPGTYVIRIATSDDDAGTFSIRADLLPEVQPNDRCVNAEMIPNAPTCEFFTVATTSTVDACPEVFTISGCAMDFTQEAVVWYSFTTPPGTQSIEIENIVANAYLAVVDGCPPPLPSLLGTGCYSGSGTNGNPIAVNPNTTYYIAIGLNNGTQGDVFFDIKYNLELENDNPCQSGFVPVVLTDGVTLTNQDNTCGTEDDEMCSDPDIDKTVWFEFTLTAPNNRVTINVTGTGADPINNPVISIFDNIGSGTPNEPCTDNPINSECNGSGMAVFNCLNPGTYLIQIGTIEADAGQFSINVEQSIGTAVANDLCTNAENINIDVICSPITLTGTNVDACPENLPPGSFNNPCDFNNEETSWYVFTAPGDPSDQPTLSFRFTDYTGSGTPFMGIFEYGTDCSNLTAVDPTCFQGLNTQFSNIGPLTPGNQYLIAISSYGDTGGDFEFEVVINLGPPNDDPCASVISIDYQLTNGVPLSATTLCAGPDPFFPDCQQTHQQNVVFFEVNVPDDIRGISIRIDPNDANGTPIPNGSTVVVGILPDACNPTTYVEAACLSLGQTHEFLCLEPGIYNIQVSTSTANEGDFNIRMTHIDYQFNCANTLNNDDCEAPLDLNPDLGTTYCTPIRITGCNQEACPESFNYGPNCPFGTMPVVWYTFTTASGVASVDILDLQGSGGTPFLAIFDNITDCDGLPTAISSCILTQETNIPVQENTTYYLAVGNNGNNGDGGTFRFDIVLNRPPENDDPDVTSDRPPFDLTGGGSHQGTTCCAIGFNDDPNLDFPNVECGGASDDNAVWYIFQVTGEEAIEIRVTPVDITGNTTVEVYPGTATAPAAQLFRPDSYSCGALPAVLRMGCLEENEYIWVKVASRNQDCGEFNISIMEADKCEYAESCADIGPDQILETAPTDLDCGEFTIIEISGCLDLACPEIDPRDCGIAENPTVWFQINTDENAVQLFTFVSTQGSWQPVWAIYSGDCDNLQLLNGGTIDMPTPCSNGNDNPDQHNVGIPFDENGNPQTTFYVAISAQGIVDDPNFTLSAFTQAGCVSCIGNDACTPEEQTVYTILERDSDRPLNDPLFCQGETVRLCIQFYYDPSETGVDWFHGFIPDFGPGWDLDAFDPNDVTTNPGGAQWYTTEDGDCAPYITARMPLLCAYTDANGVYRLCNIKCGNCPCTPPLEEGTPLPNGWFWNSNGGAGCINNCNPATHYGVPGSNTGRTIEICMTLKTKEFDDYADCEANKSLRLNFVTTSDGVSGCWNDPVAECKLDVAQVGPDWQIDCTEPVRVDYQDVELCNEGTLNSQFATQDGSSTPIIIEPIPNPNVSGMNSYTFPNGFGTVTDMLTNLTTSVQLAQYIVWAERPTDLCPGPRDTFTVTLYPQLEVNFNPIYVCYGESAELIPNVTGGTGNYVNYIWSTGATTPTITVGPLTSTTYIVTVTDDLGCTGSGEVELEVKVPVTFDIEPSPIEMCRDGINQPVTVSAVNIVANGSFGVFWDIPPGLGAQPIAGSSDVIIYDEDSQPGDYMLCATVQDQFGCSEEVCVEVNVFLADTPTFIALPLNCGDTEAILQAFFIGDAELLLFDCDDNLLQSTQATSFHEFDPVDLLESTCFRLLVISNAGCPASAVINVPLITGDQVTISGDVLVCEGSQSTISVTNPALFTGFIWSNGETGQTISPVPTPPSEIFRVTATQANGCTSTAQIEVTTQAAPQISLSGSFSFCPGGNSTITASAVPAAGTTFQWFDASGALIGSGNTITLNTAGDYSVVATSAIGCPTTEPFTISEDSQLNPSLNSVTLCDNNPDTLNAGSGFASYTWSLDGTVLPANTQKIEITQAGLYCVTVTDVTGCTGEACRTVVNNSTPQIAVTDTIEVCRQETGQGPTYINFNDQVSGAAGTWTDVDGAGVDLSNLDSVSFLSIPTGFYSFRYRTNTAQAPCLDVEEIMVVQVRTCPCPTVALLPMPDLCNDNGSVNLDNFRANAMQTGTWSVISGPQTVTLTGNTFNAAGLAPGTYTVQFEIAPVGTCPTTATRPINVFAAPTAGKTGDAILCNTAGGTSPTNIDLSTLLTPSTDPGGVWTQVSGDPISSTLPLVEVDGLNPQTLVFRYTTSNAMAPCTDASVEINVTVRDCNCPLVIIAALPDLCNGSSNIIDFNDYLTTDPTGITGTWSISPSGTIINDSQLNPFGMTSGSYVVTFSISGSIQPQCQRDFTADLLVRRQPTAVAKTGDSPCNSDTGNGPTAIDLDTWLVQSPPPSGGIWVQTGGPNTLTIQPGNIVDFDGTNPGDVYTFEYSTNVAIAPCTDVVVPISITVIDCDCPNVATMPPAAVCNSGGQLDLSTLETANIGQGSWTVTNADGNDIPLNGKILDYTGLPAGTYTLSYTLATVPGGTCPPGSQQTLRVENQNFAVIQATASVCNVDKGAGEQFLNFNNFVIDGDKSGTWTNTSGAPVSLADLNAVDFSNAVIGQTYTFTYTTTSAAPCEDRNYTILITVVDCTCTPIRPEMIPLQCSGSGTLDLTQFNDPNRPGTWSSTDVSVVDNAVDLSGLNSGSYTLTYRVNNPEPDCPDSENVTLTVLKQVSSGTATGNYTYCVGEGQTVDLNSLLTGQDPGGRWREVSGQPSQPGAFDPANGIFNGAINNAIGTYQFEYYFDNQSPCQDVSTRVSVIVNGLPTVDVGPSKVLDCVTTSVSIGGSNTEIGPNISYQWSHNEGRTVPNGDQRITSVDFPGLFTLKVINTTTGCRDSATVQVDIDPNRPQAEVSKSDITCFGANDGRISFVNVTGGQPPLRYSINGGASFQASPDFTNLGPGNYILLIRDNTGCEFNSSITITEPPLFTINLGPDVGILLGESVTLTLANTVDPNQVSAIEWTSKPIGEESTVICSQPSDNCISVTVSPENTTTYCATVTDLNGCVASDCVNITPEKVRNVTIPNIIRPFNPEKGINKNFAVFGNDINRILRVSIYDRWGELVYTTEDFPANTHGVGWDGRFKGSDVVPGVYVYLVEIEFKPRIGSTEFEREIYTGDITVIR